MAQGDLPNAVTNYRNSLVIKEQLAKTYSGNAEWQREIWSLLWRLRSLPDSGVTWAEVAARMEQSKEAGTLQSTDEGFFAQARAAAAAEAHK